VRLVRDVIRSRELLVNLIGREVKGKYKRTAGGQLWSLANPLAQMIILSLVFSQFMKMTPPVGCGSGLFNFALFLMCGLLVWNFFVNSLNGGMASLVANENLVKKVWFPRAVLPVASTGALVFTWCGEMLVLVGALLVVPSIFPGAHKQACVATPGDKLPALPSPSVWDSAVSVLPWVPLVIVFMAVLVLFAVGMSLLFSIVNVYFRDMHHLTTIITQAWFYMTPIIYPISMVAEKSDKIGPLFAGVTVLDIYRTNPMERFVAVFRSLLYDNHWPDIQDVAWVVGWTAVVVVVGIWLFGRHEKRLAEVL